MADADNDDQENESPNGQIPLAADLPVQNRRSTPASTGGVREDCWSEGATAVLIEAWGERFVALSRGSLKQQHWEEVAEIVAARAGEGKTPKTHIQCKYRIDTVKKKFKSEKAKLASAADGQPSTWRFFDRVQELLGTNNSASVVAHPPPPVSKQPHLRQRKRPVPVDFGSESEDISPVSSDSLPPANQDVRRGTKRKQPELEQPRVVSRPAAGAGKSVRELTKAILKFGEAYEKTEKAKLQQMVEMEMQRMKFAKEIEVQRMKFLVKTQVELSEISRVGGRFRGAAAGAGDRHLNGADESNVNNISNSSD